MAHVTLAFDRSERWKDQDGNLHVRVTNISKATVNPYRGAEIPGFEALGLDPDRIYQLLRDPEELKKGADSFNNLRLLSKHVAVSADDPKAELVAGSTGTDAVFNDPYLQNSLVIWRKEDIDLIESRDKCELSAAYYYQPDMTPGKYEGVQYDGVMRNLRGNHVALVEAGRAGPDVMVHDSALEMPVMPKPLASRKALLAKGALTAYLRPLVQPGTALALDAALAGVTRANWKTEKPKLLATLAETLKGKLAADASLEDMHGFVDRLDDEEDGAAKDDEIDAEDEDESEEDRAKREKAEKEAKDKAAKDAEPEPKKDEPKDDKAKDAAMDAAIQGAIKTERERQATIAEAREVVRPLIGAVSVAMDSADDIYRLALKGSGMDLAGVNTVGLRRLVEAAPKPGARTPIAMDSAAAGTLETKFPALGRIGAA